VSQKGRKLLAEFSNKGSKETNALAIFSAALGSAICKNPEATGAALGVVIVSDNRNLALASLDGLIVAASSCCSKAQQATAIGFKASGRSGKYQYRVFFAILKLGLNFCVVPLEFFL
jgi:hypothetical protein